MIIINQKKGRIKSLDYLSQSYFNLLISNLYLYSCT